MPEVEHRPVASQQSTVFLRFHQILDSYAWGVYSGFAFVKSVSASLTRFDAALLSFIVEAQEAPGASIVGLPVEIEARGASQGTAS